MTYSGPSSSTTHTVTLSVEAASALVNRGETITIEVESGRFVDIQLHEDAYHLIREWDKKERELSDEELEEWARKVGAEVRREQSRSIGDRIRDMVESNPWEELREDGD